MAEVAAVPLWFIAREASLALEEKIGSGRGLGVYAVTMPRAPRTP